jgi:putative intracellular protease/amidase
MKRVVLLALAMAVVAVTAGASGQKEAQRVLMIVRPISEDMTFMLSREVGTMTEMLKDAGYRVVVASDTGEDIKTPSTRLKVDLPLTKVRVADYSGFILPCLAAGFQPVSLCAPPSAVRVVKEAVDMGKPVAAQMSAIGILEQAGVMNGKQFAIDDAYANLVSDGVFKGNGVVQDGKIITSGTCPFLARETGRADGTPELTRRFIETMKGLQ